MSGDRGRRRGGARRPTVSETSLYSYLVTRHTGRAVRMSVRERIVASRGPLVAVLDFRNVAVIDFSCADEVVAKLIEEVRSRDRGAPTYFFFRGLDDHHRDPVESALIRRTLAVAGETAGGDPTLVGSVDSEIRAAWEAVQSVGPAPAARVAAELGLGEEEGRELLDRLSRRRLLVRVEGEYASLGRTVSGAGGEGDGAAEGTEAPRGAEPGSTDGGSGGS